MTPDDSARGKVEEIRRRWSDNSGPKSAWTDIWDLLQAYDTLEAQRDAENTSARQWAAQCGEADDEVTALRIELAQARREAEVAKGRAKMAIEEWQTEVAALTESLKQRETELGRYMMANNTLAESQSTGYMTLLRTARRLRDFTKSVVCGSDGVTENGEHSCVHHWDDGESEYRCQQARKLLISPDVQALGPTEAE